MKNIWINIGLSIQILGPIIVYAVFDIQNSTILLIACGIIFSIGGLILFYNDFYSQHK